MALRALGTQVGLGGVTVPLVGDGVSTSVTFNIAVGAFASSGLTEALATNPPDILFVTSTFPQQTGPVTASLSGLFLTITTTNVINLNGEAPVNVIFAFKGVM
jgi:hypothetical protein